MKKITSMTTGVFLASSLCLLALAPGRAQAAPALDPSASKTPERALPLESTRYFSNKNHPPPSIEWPVSELSPAKRRQRAEHIRDAAALAGMTNAALLAGIGQVETGLAHCYSEATWACQGPASSSCAGGPVIAGASDGPCSAEQGGLGIFQFDSGTYQDTINTYGADIVTLEGNVNAVIPFLVVRAIQSVPGVSTEQQALDWMNSIPIAAGDALFDRWTYFVTWRYNGCQDCPTKQAKYADGTLLMITEFGADFWASSPPPPPPPPPQPGTCQPVPAEGVTIEETDLCFAASGPEVAWHSENTGHGGRLLWTNTSDLADQGRRGLWTLQFDKSGDYEIFAYSTGGQFAESVQAAYEIRHASGTSVALFNQSTSDGWHSLGVFGFDGTAQDQQVLLSANTGEAQASDTRLLFDAISVEPLGEQPPPEETPGSGSSSSFSLCSLAPAREGLAALWPLLFVLGLLSRRRRIFASITR